MLGFAVARGVATAAALVAAVPVSASALTVTALPAESSSQPARSFSSTAHGWTAYAQNAGVCIKGLTCPQVTNTRIAAGGAGDNGGALRTTASSLLATAANASGVWQSPEFTYVGPQPDAIAFSMDRKADVATLVQVGATATYTVGLIDLADPSRSTQLVPTAGLDGARDWTRVTAPVPAGAVTAGRRYRIDIVSHFNLTVGAVVDVSAEYDNVTLAIGKRVPPTFSGPVATVASGDAATVTGAVNPNGMATGVVVEYGPTTAYGSKTTAVVAGDGLAASPFTVKVPGLTRGATYHYRVIAASADGVATTQDGAFSVVRGAASTSTTGTGVPKAKPTLSAAGAATSAIRRGGRLYVRLHCPTSARTACRITATATAKVGARTVRAGTAKASAVGRGRSRLVAFAGPHASRATLARARSLRVRVRVVDRAGHSAVDTRMLRVAT